MRAPVTPFLVSLVEEASQRTAAGSRVSDLVSGSIGFPIVVLKLLLPWSLLAVWLFQRAAWRDLWQNPWAVAHHHGVEPFSVAHLTILEPHLRMLAQAEHIPVHLGAMPASVQAVLERLGW